jgi:hypothetical protein
MNALTFSIVIETENLASGDFTDLMACLESLEKQKRPITDAHSVLILDAGRVDPEKTKPLTERFPWVQFHLHAEPVHYYKAKMEGAKLTDADIVLFADSDMVYEPNWLGDMVEPFERDGSVKITCGSTRVRLTGPYTLMMSLFWMIRTQPNKPSMAPAGGMYGNNFAVRKGWFDQYPIPHALPLYRRHIAVYVQMLHESGIKITSQHTARGYHRPPDSLKEWTMRMLVLGHDMAMIAAVQIIPGDVRPSWHVPSRWMLLRSLLKGLRARCSQAWRGWKQLRLENPSVIRWLPGMIPIAFAGLILQTVGGIITLVKPGAMLAWMNHFENPDGVS